MNGAPSVTILFISLPLRSYNLQTDWAEASAEGMLGTLPTSANYCGDTSIKGVIRYSGGCCSCQYPPDLVSEPAAIQSVSTHSCLSGRPAPIQKISFKASWISRGVFDWELMTPNVLGLLIFADGPPNTTRLKMS